MMQVKNTDLKLKNHLGELFLISVLALFLELLLIRWISTEINIFAYLQNTVLVVCFLGLGMGCLSSRQPVLIRNLLVPFTLLTLLMSVPMTRKSLQALSLLLAATGDLLVWQLPADYTAVENIVFVTIGLACTLGLMFLIWQMFVPLGRILGRLMDDHPHAIQAYSINIAGSLIGILGFALISAYYQPPRVWFFLVLLLLVYFVWTDHVHRRTNWILLFAIAALAWLYDKDAASIKVVWSPYQKLVLNEAKNSEYPFFKYFLNVNNTWYQGIIDLRPKTTESYRPLHVGEQQGFSQYDVPFLMHPNPQSVLIVGAGTGNDISGALRHSVKAITAVEIDPAIIDLGRAYHPEQPYQSPAVRVVNDDARSFFATSREKFDVISFGLLDSHTTTTMTNARLDHYVYTRESFQMAKSLLSKGGIVTLMFESQRPFITDRIARTLREVFGAEPILFRVPKSAYGIGGVMFLAGDLDAVRETIAANQKLAALISEWKNSDPLRPSYTTEVTTDNWPYLYLDSRRIPILYYLLAFLLFALFFYTKWRFKLTEVSQNWTASHWHFFFLGAAFLLLEVQNISKASVVLGNTWQVNAVIISGILIMILIANVVAATWPKLSLGMVYLGLIGSCVALYFIDLARFASLPYGQKAAIVAVLTALPVFFSGIVFIRSFAEVSDRDRALGANMIGSLVGGLLQSVTFITGIKALLLIVALLYIAALACHALPYFRRNPLEESGVSPVTNR
jgi:spermidine synthase